MLFRSKEHKHWNFLIEWVIREPQQAGYMKKKIWRSVLLLFLPVLLFAGCRVIRIEEGERTPLEYTIEKQTDLPEEVLEFIEQKKEKEFQMTYSAGNDLYLLKGYGVQMTGGYSIQVEEVSESENAVFCRTRLLGPAKEDQGGEPSCPCIVLKIKNTKKPVQFF